MENDKTFHARPLAPSPFARSPVDIIVPFHGQYDKVARLVESIYLHCRSNPYQICLVDDGSPNKTFLEQLSKLPQIKCVRNEEHLGFGAALHAGYLATEQPWVLFMHSDTVVEDGNWMLRLGECLMSLRDRGVKMASARTNNPLGGDERLKADRLEVSENAVVGKGGFLPLYCAMCHRELFNRIGGFIKAYPYALYEDEELAYRMRHHGYKQVVCGNSWVYHEGECTIRELTRERPDVKEVMESNREKCISDIKKLR